MKEKIYDIINMNYPEINSQVRDYIDYDGMLVFPAFTSDFNDDGELVNADLKKIDDKYDGMISRMIKINKFNGKEYTQTFIPVSQNAELILIGLGSTPTFQKNEYLDETIPGYEKYRLLGIKAVKAANDSSKDKVGLVFRDIDGLPDMSLSFRILAEGIIRGQYLFNYKAKEDDSKPDFTLKQIEIIVTNDYKTLADEGIKHGIITGKSANFARAAVDEPASQLYPASYVEMVKEFMKNTACDIEVKDFDWVKEQGMGCFEAVAKGNEGDKTEAKFLIIKSKKKSVNGKLALIGKGVTYDTGGYNLKPGGKFFAFMKNDMGGSAAVLAATKAIIDMDIDIELITVTALTENTISRSAIKPGDVVTSYSGKTVEILNTDAEGRLTLADAVNYVYQQEKPDYMVDVATLTGACIVALGIKYAAYMGINPENNDLFAEASMESGETFWELPLPMKYRDLIKGSVSDLTNISGDHSKWGGALIAGLFIKEFIGECKNWLHLDIAGPTYAIGKTYLGDGGLAHSVASLIRYAEKIASK
jgi:leucyl aminopeptidase